MYEYELNIGWGKAVSLPSQALPAPPPGHMAIRSKEVCDASCIALREYLFFICNSIHYPMNGHVP